MTRRKSLILTVAMQIFVKSAAGAWSVREDSLKHADGLSDFDQVAVGVAHEQRSSALAVDRSVRNSTPALRGPCLIGGLDVGPATRTFDSFRRPWGCIPRHETLAEGMQPRPTA